LTVVYLRGECPWILTCPLLRDLIFYDLGPAESELIFDRSDPAYPILARTLTARRGNLIVTVADLQERLRAIIATIPAVMPEAA
jgi:hypothetical protein